MRRAPGANSFLQSDLAYGDDTTETFDLFEPTQPRDARPAPLLVFIHGGYWRSLSKNDFSWIARSYVERGVKVAILDYGLAPRYPLERIVRQHLQAIAFLWLNADALRHRPRPRRRLRPFGRRPSHGDDAGRALGRLRSAAAA